MQTEIKTEVVLCPNCKEEVPKTLYCLNCGYPLYKMQSTPAVKEEEKVAEEKVNEQETVEPIVEAEDKIEDTVIDDFSIENVMDEVEDLGIEPEPVQPEEPEPIIEAAPEPTYVEPVISEPVVEEEPIVSEPIYTAPVYEPEPVTVEPEPVLEEEPSIPEPVVEDVTIAVEPEPVYVPEPVAVVEPEPVAVELEPAPVYQPVVVDYTPTPIVEVKTEPEPLVVSPEPVYTAPVYEPEPVIAEPVIETEPIFEAAPDIPEPVAEPEVASVPEVHVEPVVETVNMINYEPDPVIKELMGEFAKNLSMKIRLVDLLQSGEVKKETFHRLFESYLARGDHLMNSRNEMLERVKYELSSKEKSYNESKIGLEELKIKRAIGDVTEGEYSAKAPGFEWDINKYENEVNQKNSEINYLSDISKVLTADEINELTQKGNNCLEGLDQLAYSNILDPETAGRVRVSIEEAIACLKS